MKNEGIMSALKVSECDLLGWPVEDKDLESASA